MKFNLQKAIADAITQVFKIAPLLDAAPVISDDKTRAIAARALFDQVYEALSEINMSARKVDEYGNVYIDWEVYLSCLDVFYDDGALFAVVTRGGKLYRIPIDVTNDVATLGELVEIPLTARTKSRVWVTRDAKTNKRRWVSIAGSAVINRDSELDSTRLFDSFIHRANETKQFPVLSFYHQPETMRFGVADYLARDEYLYLATGEFFDDPISQAVADGLERVTDEGSGWGNSIGFQSYGDPELLDVGDGVTIPMYVDGENTEISIVLERDAAALFTRMSTPEVNRMLTPEVKQKFMQLTQNAAIVEELDAVSTESNRTIKEQNMVARANDTVTGAVTTQPPVATATQTAPVAETPAPETRDAAPQSIEIPEEMYEALAASFAETPTIQELIAGYNAMRGELDTLNARNLELETQLGSARTEHETRLVQLEKEESDKQAEWLADLAPTRTILTLRPRETRAVNLDANGQPAELDSTVLANQTLAKMKEKHATQHA